jgi:hypothetical protein
VLVAPLDAVLANSLTTYARRNTADHHDDGGVGLAIVLACCDDEFNAEMSAVAGRLRKGRHTAVWRYLPRNTFVNSPCRLFIRYL